jgi:hypothetical protein
MGWFPFVVSLARDCVSNENRPQPMHPRGKRKMRKIVCLFSPIRKKQRSVRGFRLNKNRACPARFSYLSGASAVGFLIADTIPFRGANPRKETSP